MNVAAFRRYVREQASSVEEEELIAAKMVGRWRSGAPLVLAPEHDDCARVAAALGRPVKSVWAAALAAAEAGA